MSVYSPDSTTTNRLTRSLFTLPQTTGTVAAWWYTPFAKTDSANHWLCDARSANNQNVFEVLKFSDNHIYAGWVTANTAFWATTASYTLTQNAWNHVALTWNTSTPSTVLYLGGSSAATASTLTTFDTAATAVGNWTINNVDHDAGLSAPAFVNTQNTRIAEFAIWSTDLTANEVAALALGANPARTRPASLFRYWPLWGLAGATEPDLSGAAANLTVTNMSQNDHAPVTLWARKARGEGALAAAAAVDYTAALTGRRPELFDLAPELIFYR